ncbi:MAG: FAD-dependent oxidoreductase [Lentisphaerae bacterium]|nr:FAD-dependent oxidoreductase [Lentisphaerota bacterium]
MNKTVFEPARNVPVTHEADVVVCGGGTAGIAAAVCAARLGLKVIIIENSAQFGGMMSAVTMWSGDVDNKGGFVKEIFGYMEENGFYRRPYYNNFSLVSLCDRLILENNVTPLLLTRVCSVVMDNNTVSGVIVESKQGRHAVMGRIIVDATGDGDVAAFAGAEFEYGRNSDGRIQSISLPMLVNNYHLGEIELKGELLPKLREIKPDYELPYDNGRMRRMPGSDASLWLMLSHDWECDVLNAESLSRSIIKLRGQSDELIDLVKQAYQVQLEKGPFAPLPGIRESRRIICEARVGTEDYTAGKYYEDGIFTVRHNIDIHRCKDGEPAIVVTKVNPYQIRYGSLIPRGLNHLLVIGRCIGGSHEALASYRLIADCMAMGEAAAFAAAQAVRKNCALRGVSVATLRRCMQEAGYEL